jgi:hypothetical protein
MNNRYKSREKEAMMRMIRNEIPNEPTIRKWTEYHSKRSMGIRRIIAVLVRNEKKLFL